MCLVGGLGDWKILRANNFQYIHIFLEPRLGQKVTYLKHGLFKPQLSVSPTSYSFTMMAELPRMPTLIQTLRVGLSLELNSTQFPIFLVVDRTTRSLWDQIQVLTVVSYDSYCLLTSQTCLGSLYTKHQQLALICQLAKKVSYSNHTLR